MRPRASLAPSILGAAMRAVCVLAIGLTLVDCGGGSTSASTPTTNYTLGGTISGLTVSSVVLANGSSTVTVSSNAATWTFPASFAAGSSYSVTVKTQPAGETCAVTSGASGVNTGDVGNVTVVCGFGQWAWETGATSVNANGVYGTQGTASAGTEPGARYSGTSWTDSSGNFWLFGGVGYDSSGSAGYLNDLWRYTPGSKQWTWISGGDGNNASGIYGTLNSAATGNAPGARYEANSWIDSTGNLWLFGGYGYDSAGNLGYLNDLWRYAPGTGQWTWVNGSNIENVSGVYGAKGTAAAGNAPGARRSASSWTDSNGTVWLFGGYGYDASGAVGYLNDLWKYSPTTRQWTWVSGGSVDNALGVYGTVETAAAANVPGARYAAGSWIDASGNLWLFGGAGYDSGGALGKLNDLWQFTPTSGQWTWVGGEVTANAGPIYGTLGTTAATNLPGARYDFTTWMDSSGSVWLFGGVGYDASGTVGNLNDLWRYDPTDNEWTWIGGGHSDNASGVYGTQGTASVNNVPGGRNSINSWIDSSGDLWLFGGNGYDSTGKLSYLNDLWEFNSNTAN
jgi:N-acetylneuraminic acid mutarotase